MLHRLVLVSYQSYKLNNSVGDDNLNQDNNEEKEILNNIFNTISNYLMKNLLILDHIFLYKLIDIFYNSLFYTIALNINDISVIITASEKLIKEANQILCLNNNSDENILKYIFIILAITNNIGKEKKDILFNLLDKIELNNDTNQETYFKKIQNNILKIINSNINSNNFNKEVIDGIILLNNSFVSFFMDKAIQYFEYFNQIITLIISTNQRSLKIYNLTLNLYTQIFAYNINTDKYENISKIGFDVLNSINIFYNSNKDKKDIIFLANKQTEFIILYIQKSSHFINNINNNEIFINTFNNILNIFDESNNKKFSINFINLIKILIDFSNNNNFIMNILKEKFIEKILRTIIDHIKYFNEMYKNCISNSFYIFSNCINSPFEEKFIFVINDCFKEKQITEIIIEYLKFNKNNNFVKNIDTKIKEFMNDLNGLYQGTDRTKYEFIEKYSSKLNNYKSGNINNTTQTIKVNPNSQMYINLYPK